MIKIWFDGVEPALDVFGNLPKQLMNFAEMGGRIIQIDVGEKEQSIGVRCFFFFKLLCTLSRKKIVQKAPHCVATCIEGPHNISRHP